MVENSIITKEEFESALAVSVGPRFDEPTVCVAAGKLRRHDAAQRAAIERLKKEAFDETEGHRIASDSIERLMAEREKLASEIMQLRSSIFSVSGDLREARTAIHAFQDTVMGKDAQIERLKAELAAARKPDKSLDENAPTQDAVSKAAEKTPIAPPEVADWPRWKWPEGLPEIAVEKHRDGRMLLVLPFRRDSFFYADLQTKDVLGPFKSEFRPATRWQIGLDGIREIGEDGNG